MNTTSQFHEQLTALAAHLRVRREGIFSAWREVAQADPELTTNSSLSRSQFIDHMPDVLDTYELRLQCWPGEITQNDEDLEESGVKLHGLHRWQQGYRLRELTREWGHLQMCLIDEVGTFTSGSESMRAEVVTIALRILSQICVAGVSDSTTQYWSLQQAEAAGHVRDLEQALATLNELENTRANTWRQAAHDLRGGLTVVKAASHILQTEDLPEAARVKSSAMLQRSIASLHEMLTDLVDLARLQAGQEKRSIEPFDAATLIRDFCSNMQPLAAEQHLTLHTAGPETLIVEGDRAKVQRILQNLLLNALKYTGEGGITVSWGRCEKDATRWHFSVRDTGPGIDTSTASLPAELAAATRIAQEVENPAPREVGPPTQHDAPPPRPTPNKPILKQHPSEGIGLSIVKGLCDLLDATLELETESGQGSVFRVGLPVGY